MASPTVDIAKPRNRFLELLTGHPAGFWFIFWGELAERCSYYGMMSILARFISEALKLGDADANTWVSIFKAACYVLPLLGGFLADQYLGKYRLIIIFSIPYILGHIVLADETMTSTLIALALLAMGSGVIKPNISTLMGLTYDQKRPGNEVLRSMAFGMFYMAINVGALLSYAVLPKIRDYYGYSWAFICPAILMGISFIIFAVGKPFYAVETIQRRKSTPQEWADKMLTLRRVAGIFLVVTFFWAIFDQSHTTWVFFARDFTDLRLFGGIWSPEQVGLLNPLMIILFVPFLSVIWAFLDGRGLRVRATDKMMIGFLLTALTMGIMAISGYLAGAFTSVPALKGASEQAPYLVTEPPLVPKEISEWQKEEKKKTPPTLQNLDKVQFVWVGKSTPPRIDKQPGKITVSWGDKPENSAIIDWPNTALTPKVTLGIENDVTIEWDGKGDKMRVEYKDEASPVREKRLVNPNEKVSLWWQVLAFVTLTFAEVLISVTGLELAFVVAPATMKSFVTALWLLTVGIANFFINAPVGRVYNDTTPGNYFLFLTGLMVVVMVSFHFVAQRFNQLPALSTPPIPPVDLASEAPPVLGDASTGIQAAHMREGTRRTDS